MREREIWIDTIKITAIALVVLGHFFTSLILAGILPGSPSFAWAYQAGNVFLMPLLFVCSGYIYQKRSQVFTFRSWLDNVSKKALSLGGPYFSFSVISWTLKNLFKSSINLRESGFARTLFIEPMSPYWFLYVLFLLFLVTPNFKSKSSMWRMLFLSLFMKLLGILAASQTRIPFAVHGVLSYQIWFVLGMVLSSVDFKKIFGIWTLWLGPAYLVLSWVMNERNGSSQILDFLLGVMACTAAISIAYRQFGNRSRSSTLFRNIGKFSFPVYLMHTIFAAGWRILLLRSGVMNPAVHIISGILISFLGPVVATIFMEKIKVYQFFLHPDKFVRFKKNKMEVQYEDFNGQ